MDIELVCIETQPASSSFLTFLLFLLFLLLFLLVSFQLQLVLLHLLLIVLTHEHQSMKGQDAPGHRTDIHSEHHIVVFG